MPAVSTKPARRLRFLAILSTVAAAGLLLAGTASSQTVTPQSVDPLQHFIDCAGVLITAPDVHAANCMPNNIPPDMKSLAGNVGDDTTDCIEDDVLLDSAPPPCRPEGQQ